MKMITPRLKHKTKHKTLGLMICLLLGLMIISGACIASPGSVEQGKALFNDSRLAGSSDDKSCNSCHNDGMGLEMSSNNPKIEQQINRCIVGALQGKALEIDTPEMQSLKKYLVSLGE